MVYIGSDQNLIRLILKTYWNTKGIDLQCPRYKLYNTPQSFLLIDILVCLMTFLCQCKISKLTIFI